MEQINAKQDLPRVDQPKGIHEGEEFNLDDIRHELIDLDANDTIWRKLGDDYKRKIEKGLLHIESKLETLKDDSKDFHRIYEMYKDLKHDFENNENLRLDSSFGNIMLEILNDIKAKNILQSDSVFDLPNGITKNTVESLIKMGIQPEYTVLSQESDAPTVILFLQAHPFPGFTHDELSQLGIIDCQNLIEKNIITINEAGLSSVIYGEGIGSGKTINVQQAKKDESLGYTRAKVMQGKKIDLRGFDDSSFLRKSRIELDYPTLEIRRTAHNIWLSSNIAQSLEKDGHRVSMAVLGVDHELLPDQKHPLPFSTIAAYTGINVIVVNTATHFDHVKLQNMMIKNPQIEERIRKAMGMSN